MAKAKGKAMVGGATGRANVAALVASGDVRAPALAKRCEQVGAKHALDPKAGTPLGRALLLGMITEGQYRAGVQLEAVVQLWRITQGLGRDSARSIDGLRLGGSWLGAREFDPGEIAAATARYQATYRALTEAGRGAHMVTVGVVMRGESITDETLALLRHGLNKLSNHFNRGQGNRVLVWSADGRVSIDERFWTAPESGRISNGPGRIGERSSPRPERGRSARAATG